MVHTSRLDANNGLMSSKLPSSPLPERLYRLRRQRQLITILGRVILRAVSLLQDTMVEICQMRRCLSSS
jgi:hypothetical protein